MAVASDHAAREKQTVALLSLLAAVGLTAGKLIVGLATNSLGILSEAAHSGLDLVAAVVTLWAVRISSRPADQDHTYGHGKFENLSALVETLLLLLTCVWIVWEAAQRLFFDEHIHVQANVWAFLVVIASIIVDYRRSRALMHAARKYKSQALEADALHFSTDIWSSCVVLLGLIGVRAADVLELPWLMKADAVAASGVAVIVIWVGVQLGRRAIDDLLDRIPDSIREAVATAAAAVPGVVAVRQVRVRRSGGELFADMTVQVDHRAAFEGAHEIADRAASAVREALPSTDVVVHVEPTEPGTDDPLALVRMLAARYRLGAHGIRLYEEDGQRILELHLEVDPTLTLDEAHAQASRFERVVRENLNTVSRIITHIEPAGEAHTPLAAQPIPQLEIERALDEFFAANPGFAEPHQVQVRRIGGVATVSLHIRLDPATGIVDAHSASERLESFLRRRVPGIDRVMIHVEPLRG
jgi:cation diffusion facilitator family transporter